MCDYSLHSVASRPAKVSDKLTTWDFGTGTIGFAAAENARVAVCVLPGTELAFSKPVECAPGDLMGWAGRPSITDGDFSADQQRARFGASRRAGISGRKACPSTSLWKVRRQWCFSCRHSLRLRRKEDPRSASRTLSEHMRAEGLRNRRM